MLRTMLPALLLGVAVPAMAQEADDTTSALPGAAASVDARPEARARGASRGASTTSQTRSNGAKTMTRTTQTSGDRSRTKTTGTVSHGGQGAGHRYGGETSRTVSSWSNGNRTVTQRSGEAWRAEAWRQNGANGGQRTLGTVTRTHKESGPGGAVTTTSSTHTRGASSTGNRVEHRAGTRTDTGGARPTAIPAGSRPPVPGRVGSPPPRAGNGPGDVRPSAGRGGGGAPPVRVGSTPPRVGHGPGDVRHAPIRTGPPVRVPSSHVHVRTVPTRVRTITYTHVRPYHGVFVYGPRPVTHVQYVDAGGPVEVRQADLPKRELDRENSLAIGLKGGSLWSGYVGAHGYADIGAGLSARYRPDEAVGLELAILHADQTWSTASERSQTQFAGSVELFAWPWTRVSPYVLGGLTYTARDIHDEIYSYEGLASVETGAPLFGPHAGVGVELALGRTVALDLEARYVGYLNRQATDASYPGALTTTAGVVVHF